MHLDSRRLEISSRLDRSQRSSLGQFLTPTSVADFMAGLFPQPARTVRLLDAGAGIGSLTAAFLARWGRCAAIETTAYEIDPVMRAGLADTLAACGGVSRIVETDFIEDAVNALQFGTGANFTHAILNPPYKKINSASRHRLLLRQAGIETVNLYSAFVALALALLVPGGQLVAIIPRSFQINGVRLHFPRLVHCSAPEQSAPELPRAPGEAEPSAQTFRAQRRDREHGTRQPGGVVSEVTQRGHALVRQRQRRAPGFQALRQRSTLGGSLRHQAFTAFGQPG